MFSLKIKKARNHLKAFMFLLKEHKATTDLCEKAAYKYKAKHLVFFGVMSKCEGKVGSSYHVVRKKYENGQIVKESFPFRSNFYWIEAPFWPPVMSKG